MSACIRLLVRLLDRSCNNHEFDWDNARILHRENRNNKMRKIAEMCYIKSCDNTINLQNDIVGLPLICLPHDNVLK